jgi:ABC-type nitrate/sulfonate/bicarbonate transport system permease component
LSGFLKRYRGVHGLAALLASTTPFAAATYELHRLFHASGSGDRFDHVAKSAWRSLVVFAFGALLGGRMHPGFPHRLAVEAPIREQV